MLNYFLSFTVSHISSTGLVTNPYSFFTTWPGTKATYQSKSCYL